MTGLDLYYLFYGDDKSLNRFAWSCWFQGAKPLYFKAVYKELRGLGWPRVTRLIEFEGDGKRSRLLTSPQKIEYTVFDGKREETDTVVFRGQQVPFNMREFDSYTATKVAAIFTRIPWNYACLECVPLAEIE